MRRKKKTDTKQDKGQDNKPIPLDTFLNVSKNFRDNLNTLIDNEEFDISAVISRPYDVKQRKGQISHRRLAHVLGVSQTSVYNWCDYSKERPNANPSMQALSMIAAGFNVSVDFLLSDHNNAFVFDGTWTYYSLFSTIKTLDSIATVTAIKDPFLQYLLENAKKIDDAAALGKEARYRWYSTLKEDFDKPFITDTETVKIFAGALNKDMRSSFLNQEYSIVLDVFDTIQRYYETDMYFDIMNFIPWCERENIAYDKDKYGGFANTYSPADRNVTETNAEKKTRRSLNN